MNLLFITNLYPPHHISGYEMLCHEAATHLKMRGHLVSVLTSTYGVTRRQDEPGIYRRLELESDIYYYRVRDILRYVVNKRSNYVAIKELMAELAPDVVVIWGMWNLSRLVAAWAERLAGPRVVYYLADVWPGEPSAHEAFWDGTANSLAGNLFKRVVRVPVRLALRQEWRPYHLRFEHAIASCQSTRDELLKAGLPMDHCQVIYEGIDPIPYHKAAERREPDLGNSLLRVVFVGTLVPHKGAHTAIEAFGCLAESGAPPPMHLTILGAGHPQYEKHLYQLVNRWQLDDQVSFHQPIPRSQLPDFLAQFDVLVMPSVYKEPLARISQEAMAAGLALVGTLTGGTKEILVDGENGLVFPPGDSEALARQLARLADDPLLRQKLSAAARSTVGARFTIDQMIDGLESLFGEVVNTSAKTGRLG